LQKWFTGKKAEIPSSIALIQMLVLNFSQAHTKSNAGANLQSRLLSLMPMLTFSHANFNPNSDSGILVDPSCRAIMSVNSTIKISSTQYYIF